MAVKLPEHIHLTVVTPYRQLVDETVDEVLLPGELGQLGILPGHRPLLTTLTIGEIAYRQGRRWNHLAVEWGFAEVLPDRVIVLAENAESVDDIDPEEILRAKQRAEERLRSKIPGVDIAAELQELQRIYTRMAILEKARKQQKEET